MPPERQRTLFTATQVQRLAQQTGSLQPVVCQVLGASLAAGERVTMPGFGTFYTAERQAVRVRSVRNGQQLTIPARRCG